MADTDGSEKFSESQDVTAMATNTEVLELGSVAQPAKKKKQSKKKKKNNESTVQSNKNEVKDDKTASSTSDDIEAIDNNSNLEHSDEIVASSLDKESIQESTIPTEHVDNVEQSILNKNEDNEEDENVSIETKPELHKIQVLNATKQPNESSMNDSDDLTETKSIPPVEINSDPQNSLTIEESGNESKNPTKNEIAVQAPSPPKTKKSSGAQWGSFLKRAVANVEQTLDKVIQDTASSPVTSAPSEIASPSPKASGRLSLQERLAMAVDRKSSESSRSPKTSIDSPRPSSAEIKNSVTADSIDPPTNITEISDPQTTTVSTKQTSNDITQTPADNDLDGLILGIEDESIRERIRTQLYSYSNKLKILSSIEADRARSDKASSSGLKKQLAEKQEQIALLMEEGMNMSKNELKLMNLIKDLRSKVKELQRQQENAHKDSVKYKAQLKDLQQKSDKEIFELKEQLSALQESSAKESQVSKERIESLEDFELRFNEIAKNKTELETENEILTKTNKDLLVNNHFENYCFVLVFSNKFLNRTKLNLLFEMKLKNSKIRLNITDRNLKNFQQDLQTGAVI